MGRSQASSQIPMDPVTYSEISFIINVTSECNLQTLRKSRQWGLSLEMLQICSLGFGLLCVVSQVASPPLAGASPSKPFKGPFSDLSQVQACN